MEQTILLARLYLIELLLNAHDRIYLHLCNSIINNWNKPGSQSAQTVSGVVHSANKRGIMWSNHFQTVNRGKSSSRELNHRKNLPRQLFGPRSAPCMHCLTSLSAMSFDHNTNKPSNLPKHNYFSNSLIKIRARDLMNRSSNPGRWCLTR